MGDWLSQSPIFPTTVTLNQYVSVAECLDRNLRPTRHMYHRIAQLSQVSINHSKRLAAAYSSSQSASIAVSVLSNHYHRSVRS